MSNDQPHDQYADVGVGPSPDNADARKQMSIQPRSWQEAAAARSLFWSNVMREILTSLASESLRRPKLEPGDLIEAAGDTDAVEFEDDDENVFDGRVAILTRAGERIPIADIQPIMSCGVGNNEDTKALSMAVECSVFQIKTPTGEIFTLPLEEMRGFHALTPQLMAHIERSARRKESGISSDGSEPFGFAAFTSLAQGSVDTAEEDAAHDD